MVHATTVVTNALIERKGRPTALLVTEGFRDVLHIRNEHRYEMYDPQIEFPDPLVPSELTFGVAERVLADGAILRKPDDRARSRRSPASSRPRAWPRSRSAFSTATPIPPTNARLAEQLAAAAAGCLPDAVVGGGAADPRISARLDRRRQRLHHADLAALSAAAERTAASARAFRTRR